MPPESPIWARSFGDEWPQAALGLAVRPSGELFVTGRFHGEVDFGDGALTAGDNPNAFLASFGSTGEVAWSAGFGDNGSQEGRAVAAGADGSVALTGAFSGKVDFGGGELQSQGSWDVFVARFDAGGDHAWSARFGDNANQKGHGIALSPDGDAVVAGVFNGSIDFGGGALESAGTSDAFVAQFDSSDAHDWSVRAGTVSPQRANAIAVSLGGDFFVAGEFQGGVDFGACSSMGSAGEHDIFLVKLDAGGNCHFSRRFGDAADQYAFGVAHAPGPLTTVTAIAGTFAGTLDIGGDAVSAADTRDAYVVVQTENGTGWVRRIGGPGEQVARAVAFDAEGNVVVTGDYALSVDGDLLPPSAGGRDLFVIKYSSTGAVLWARRFGGEGDQFGNAIGTDALGYVYVAGGFSGEIPLADETLESQGYDDIVLLKLAP